MSVLLSGQTADIMDASLGDILTDIALVAGGAITLILLINFVVIVYFVLKLSKNGSWNLTASTGSRNRGYGGKRGSRY